MKLPIQLVETDPPKFKWMQEIETLRGTEVVEQEGVVPIGLESALIKLIELATKQDVELRLLRKKYDDLLKTLSTKPMEAKPIQAPPTPQQISSLKGKKG